MADPPQEPALTEEERAAFQRGVAQFNTGFFFECHDTLEELWAGIRGPSRDFFQGLIQVSVAFYHLTGGNQRGARSLLGRALPRLEKYPSRYCGLELGAHRAALKEWERRISEGSISEGSLEELPRWEVGSR